MLIYLPLGILCLIDIAFGEGISLADFDKIKNDPKRWRELYNFFDKVNVCDENNKNTILSWSTECILVCNSEGKNRMLDRIKNRFDVGLGDRKLEEASGSGDTGPFNGDPCDVPEQIIPHTGTQDYIKICNENKKTEVLSMTFSECPSGSAEVVVTERQDFKGFKENCVLTTEDDDSNLHAKLEHNKAWEDPQPDGTCNVMYCCYGALYASRGEKCDLESRCESDNF